ncbi:MAG: disulfide oxidoreductase [Deltaproteobacteria bacterium]|nr:disulfide oxidoreductase [Deltaproteobacteria bacterium]
MTKEGPIKPEMILGDVLKAYPSVREKIREFFGLECLQCHSNRRETMIYTSWHRGLDPAQVCRELNALLKEK